MTCKKYLKDLKALYEQNIDYVEVAHDPMSPRYTRSQFRLKNIIKDSECLGCTEVEEVNGRDRVELVTWVDPNNMGFKIQNSGEYVAFKIEYVDKQPYYSELFAYYDDEPTAIDKGNRAFYNKADALKHMLTYNKYKECE